MRRWKSVGRRSLELLVLSFSLHSFVENQASTAAIAVFCANQDHTGPHISHFGPEDILGFCAYDNRIPLVSETSKYLEVADGH